MGGWQGIQLSEGVWMSGREGQSGGLKIWICFVLYCLVFFWVCLFFCERNVLGTENFQHL